MRQYTVSLRFTSRLLTPCLQVIPYFISDMQNQEAGIKVSDQDWRVIRHHSRVEAIAAQADSKLAAAVPGVGMFEVESAEEPGKLYIACMADGSCTCPSAVRGQVCKHVEAAAQFVLDAVATTAERAGKESQTGQGDTTALASAVEAARRAALTGLFVSGATLLVSRRSDLLVAADSGPAHNIFEFSSLGAVVGAPCAFRPLVTYADRPHCTCAAFEACGLCPHVLAVAGLRFRQGQPLASDEALHSALGASVLDLERCCGSQSRGWHLVRFNRRARDEEQLTRASEVGRRDLELLAVLRSNKSQFGGPAAWPAESAADSAACDDIRIADPLTDLAQQATFVTEEEAALLADIAARARQRAQAAAAQPLSPPEEAARDRTLGVPDNIDTATPARSVAREGGGKSGNDTPYGAGGLVTVPDITPPGANRQPGQLKRRALHPDRAKPKSVSRESALGVERLEGGDRDRKLLKVAVAGRPKQRRKGLGG